MLFTTRFRHAVRCVLLLFPLICAICTAQAQSSQNKVELTPEFLAKMQKYTDFGAFHGGYALVQRAGKWGYIDTQGNEVVACKYETPRPVKDSFDPDTVFSFCHYRLRTNLQPSEVRLPVVRAGKCGYVDATGKEVISCKYAACDAFYGNLARVQVQEGGSMGLINTQGREVLTCTYDYIERSPVDGLIFCARRLVDGGWECGLVDTTGTALVPVEYNDCARYINDIVAVCKKGKWGYVNKMGKEFVPLKYDFAQLPYTSYRTKIEEVRKSFASEQALLSEGLRFQELKNETLNAIFVGEKGDTVLRLPYHIQNTRYYDNESVAETEVPIFREGCARVRLDGKWGYINQRGEFVLPPLFYSLEPFSDGLALVERDVLITTRTKERKVLHLKGFAAPDGQTTLTHAYIRQMWQQALANPADFELYDYPADGEETNWITDPFARFTAVGDHHNGLCVACREGMDAQGAYSVRYGVVRYNEEEVVPFRYDWLYYAGEKDTLSLYCGLRDGKYGVVCSDSTECIPFVYDRLDGMERLSKEFISLQGNKQGFVTLAGREVLACRFDKVERPRQGLLYATLEGKRGVADLKGNTIVPFEYSYVGEFANGLAWVCRDNLYGLITLQGQLRQPCQMKDIFRFDKDLRLRYNPQMPPLFRQTPVYFETEKGLYGLMDGEGRTLAEPKFDCIKPFDSEVTACCVEEKWGFMKPTGEVIYPCVYEQMVDVKGQKAEVSDTPFNCADFIHVSQQGKWGLLKAGGAPCMEITYDSIGSFHDDRILFKRDDRYGFADKEGQEVIAPTYNAAKDFSEGLAPVWNKDDKVLFIDPTGAVVIKPHRYDRVEGFRDGKCKVSRKDSEWYIDREGKKVKEK